MELNDLMFVTGILVGVSLAMIVISLISIISLFVEQRRDKD